MLPTPRYDLSQHSGVYEPREDTFLFLDGLEKEIEFLNNINPQFAVEIGSGSGILISALSMILKNYCVYFATDINEMACKATLNTVELNDHMVDCVCMDLLNGFKTNMFDVILFNPPYVPTDSSEISSSELSRAWAGGLDGCEIIDKVLSNLCNLLTTGGVCYMILLRENNIKHIQNKMVRRNFQNKIVINRKVPGEHLYVLKFWRV